MRRRRALAAVAAPVWAGAAGCLERVADATSDLSGGAGNTGGDGDGGSDGDGNGTDAGENDEAIGAGSPLIDESLRTVQALPDPDGAWDRRDVSALATDGTDAIEGTGATYVHSEEGEYLVHVIIWPAPTTASERANRAYAEWDQAVARGDATLACDGPSAGTAGALLRTSSELDDLNLEP